MDEPIGKVQRTHEFTKRLQEFPQPLGCNKAKQGSDIEEENEVCGIRNEHGVRNNVIG